MIGTSHGKTLLGLLLALALAYIVFTAFPGIDVWVSSQFYDQTAGHWPGATAFYSTYRGLFNGISVSLGILCLVLWGVTTWRGPVLEIPNGIWGFVALLYLLGPGLLVNALLKSYWGRARPGDVTEFGGANLFTPAFEISDQCQSNCSFVSGEGSSAAALFISVLVLSAYIRNRTVRYAIVTFTLVCSLAAAFMRVVAGRHFLSDTLGAILFVSLIAVLLHWLLVGRKQDTPQG